MRCFYYITDCTDPYRNLALEELLLRATEPDMVLLYLWQNDNTVVIGRNQNAWRECRLEEFEAQKGRLARRLSGGGAVYHDMGNQNFTFLAGNDLYDVEQQTQVIQRAVSSLGIEAVSSGRNDLLVQGRKFSGHAYHRSGRASLHHGTLLISSDLSQLGRFLAPSKEKLASKGVESVQARVMNLCECSPGLSPTAMRVGLLRAFETIYGMAPEPYQLSDAQVKALEPLVIRYGQAAWRVGRLSAFQHELRHRFSFGELEFLFSVESGVVQGVQIYSDVMDAFWVQALGDALAKRPFSAEALAKAVPECPGAPEQREQVAQYLCAAL